MVAFPATGQSHQGQTSPSGVDHLQQGAEVWAAAARGVLTSGSLGRTDGDVALQTRQGGSGNGWSNSGKAFRSRVGSYLLVAATGLRISEALGLQWQDVDYEGRQINLRRVWVGKRVFERLKTERSEAPVPLTDLLAECLRAWHIATVYGQPSDWVFASKRSRGRKPRSASILTADYLRPAALTAGVQLRPGQRFGFHNFRHGLATYLVNQGTDVKTVQGLLRHANVTTTLGKYAHTVDASMMAVQEAVLQAMKSGNRTVN